MAVLVDCPSCLRLIEAREHACPFCKSRLRRAEVPNTLLLGFVLGLATAGCTDKPDGPTSSDPTVPMTSGVAYAGPPPTSSVSVGTDSATDGETSTSTSTSTGSTTMDPTDATSVGSAAAYAAAPPTEGTGATAGTGDEEETGGEGG